MDIMTLYNIVVKRFLTLGGGTMDSGKQIAFPAETGDKIKLSGTKGIAVNTGKVTIYGASGDQVELRDGPAGSVIGTFWHSGNDGSSSGLDADLLDGANSATTATASTICLRDSDGDGVFRSIETNIANSATGIAATDAVGFRVDNSTDKVLRFTTRTQLITWLQAGGLSNVTTAHYNGSVTGSTPSDVTITSVDTAKSYIVINSDLAAASIAELYFLNTTTVRVEHSGTGSHGYAFTVVSGS